ncbi:carboxypeptidase-like regulatory domain-containing protein [Acidipila sp. EB88]|uniref:TonB-dependent receptor n=1 Tax=Acidipila sp. EB88 TaxID=2305226 RepID=UPI000F5EE6B8|nr:carboxypeptidase-like regulatory domain-containing protein [Acidipila sp. EB88]RRA48474.1 carboxypeptidase regulatory-like domain-containing protein [Acidipila sp. EB88]
MKPSTLFALSVIPFSSLAPRHRMHLLLVSLLLSLVLMPGAAARAQATNGTINGTLTDQSGGVVANAPVTVTNLGTTDTRVVQTNASGFYEEPNLAPGNYRISVQRTGYKQLTREPVVLQVDSTLEVNLTLEVGSDAEKVVVTGSTPLIQAESVSLGAVIDQRETNEIPLNGRNPMALVALAPSVVPQGQSEQNPNGANPFGWGNYQIGGGFANQSVTYLDGAPVNTEYINLTSLIPTQDSLQEFKVETNNLTPDYGRLAGGAVQFRTKSGTNQLHGSVWEYIRNKVLDANTYYGNNAGLPKPAFTQNQYGFNVGGPVLIPHLYDGRGKTFFFVNWEGFGLRQGVTYTTIVPTAAERTGDLSDLNTAIFDPLSTCGVAGGPACTPAQSQYDRTAFANGVIPASRLNATSLAYLNTFFPQPNIAGAAPGNTNYTTTGSSGGNNYETVVHIDENLSEKQHISARYSYWENNNLPTVAFNGICEDRCGELFNTNSFVLADDYAFSSKTILDLRVSYLRFVYTRAAFLSTFNVTSIGQPAALQSQIQFPGPPTMSISGFDPQNIFNSQGADSTINNHTDDDRVSGSLTHFIGNHTLRVGGEFLRATFNYAQTNNSAGGYTFNNSFTASNPLTGTGGLGLASFLLGYASGGSATSVIPIAAQQLYPAVFVNDDWKASSKLTVHVGVRWEDTQPFTERHDRQSYFDPTAPNSVLQAAGLPALPGEVGLVASSTRSSRFPFDNPLLQFSPRVGLAFEAAPHTVFSAGYGIFWLPNDVAYLPYSDPVIASTTNMVTSINGGLTPANTIDNPFPQGLVAPVGRSANFQQTLLGEGLTEAFNKNPFAYTQQFNAGVQQQIGNSFVLDIAWGGAKGTHLPFSGLNMDTLPDQDLALGSALVNQVANPFYGIINPVYGLGAPTIPAGQLLLPFPQYGGVSSGAADLASSTYNSLQLQAQQHFGNGASINAAYTWSKLLSDTDTITTWLESSVPGVQDPRNLKAEKSLSANDAAQRFVLSYVYDLPFGHGRRFLAAAPRAVDYTLGGWGFGGVTTLMSGFPLGLGTNQNLTNSFGGGSRPNYVPGCAKLTTGPATARLNNWFNTACFTQPAAFTFGDEPRLDPQLRGPGIADWDASAYKNFPITKDGRATVQFRAEAFNLFNRVQFGYPGLTQGTSNFGVISSQLNNPRLFQFSLRVNY